MKFSYRNQPILKMLETSTPVPLALHSQDKNELSDDLLFEMGELWKIYAPLYNENIKVLSLPFSQAVPQSADKLTSGDLIDKAFLENGSGTLILNDRVFCYCFFERKWNIWQEE